MIGQVRPGKTVAVRVPGASQHARRCDAMQTRDPAFFWK